MALAGAIRGMPPGVAGRRPAAPAAVGGPAQQLRPSPPRAGAPGIEVPPVDGMNLPPDGTALPPLPVLQAARTIENPAPPASPRPGTGPPFAPGADVPAPSAEAVRASAAGRAVAESSRATHESGGPVNPAAAPEAVADGAALSSRAAEARAATPDVAAPPIAAELADRPRMSREGPSPRRAATIEREGAAPAAKPDATGGSAPAPDAARPVSAPMPASHGQHSAFEDALGRRLLWMVQHGRQDAKLQVAPERLGNVEIHLKLDGDEARITLSSPNASVRDALELAAPRLRELMSDAGLDLTRLDVGTGDTGSSETSRRDDPETRPPSPGVDAPRAADGALGGPMPRLAVGLVDTYA